MKMRYGIFFFFSSRRRHTRLVSDWSSDVCSSDLRRSEDGALVGWLNVSDIVRGALQGANVSYGGVATHRGQGYMSEALELVLQEAFVTLDLHRLEANIQPANAGSLGLVRRAGFELEGFSPGYLRINGGWRD